MAEHTAGGHFAGELAEPLFRAGRGGIELVHGARVLAHGHFGGGEHGRR